MGLGWSAPVALLLLGCLAAGGARWGAEGPLALVALLSAGALAVLARRPLRLVRSADAVGYLAQPGASRAEAVRRARKSRRIGQLPPVYPNGWFLLLESAQLRRGEARNVAALGEQFAVFRGSEGKAYVVDAYCPHLGANLGAGGQVVGSCIECPFHGWQFSGESGKCTRIPYSQKVPECAKIKVWPSCEVDGMILVWYHCDGIDPTWQVPEHEEVASCEWVYRGITEHFINTHIEEIPENAADVAHLHFLHKPSVFSGSHLQHINSKFWEFFRHQWEAEWQPDEEPNAHCSLLSMKHSVTLFGNRIPMLDLIVSARQVGPGLVFLIFEHAFLGRGLLIHSVTPVEPLMQHVVHRMYYQRNMPALIPKLMLWAECVQFERDIMIWNNKQHTSKPLLVKEDAAIQRHRRWYSQFYSENSVKFTGQQPTLDW